MSYDSWLARAQDRRDDPVDYEYLEDLDEASRELTERMLREVPC